jgi:phenylalanyl-tRNA synthetase beta chain
VKSPFKNNIKADNTDLTIEVEIENEAACNRYAGISISNITVGGKPRMAAAIS